MLKFWGESRNVKHSRLECKWWKVTFHFEIRVKMSRIQLQFPDQRWETVQSVKLPVFTVTSLLCMIVLAAQVAAGGSVSRGLRTQSSVISHTISTCSNSRISALFVDFSPQKVTILYRQSWCSSVGWLWYVPTIFFFSRCIVNISFSSSHHCARHISHWAGDKRLERGDGTVTAKQQADFISAPEITTAAAATEVKRVVGNCCVFH